jgi:ribosomal protein S18 acetylase RimI-like enzyme
MDFADPACYARRMTTSSEETPDYPLTSTVPIGAATREDIGWLVAHLSERAPAHWMRCVPQADLRRFLVYAAESRRCALLLARPAGEAAPAGYVFAVLDTRGFWLGFALRHPVSAQKIFLQSLYRSLERRHEISRRTRAGVGADELPAFAWSPSHPSAARIIGLHVKAEHRRKGIATDLYFKLFAVLTEKGAAQVEEYMSPNYTKHVGKFPEVCGWRLQKCRCEGYKITKTL